MRRVTLTDVARKAGVSTATVSYVLNETPGHRISGPVRERVRSAASSLGYTPRAAARTLRTGRSRTVLALVPGLAMGYEFDRELDLLHARLLEAGYALVVHRHGLDARGLETVVAAVDPAVVIATGELASADRATVAGSGAALVDITGLIDDAAIGRTQVEHLLSAGHRRIGIAAPLERELAQFATPRTNGALAAAADAGIDAPVLVEGVFDPEGAAAAIATWRAAGATAVCAHNDEIGLALLAVRGADGVAVIGADDIPLAAFGLTTVRIDAAALATHIAALVTAALDGRPAPEPPGPVLTLVPRSSA